MLKVNNNLNLKSASNIYIYIVAALLISFISLIIVSSSAFADNLDYSVTVQPSLSVTTSASDISLNLNPATNPFDSENLTVSVGTNNQTGYKLYVSTPSNTTNLVEQNDSNLYIETLASEVSENNFTPNRWGYKLNSSSTNYTPFESGILVNSSDGPVNNVSTTMTFAAKASYGTRAGTYNLALNFQATANPMAPSIQEYDNATCATEASSQSVTVIDERDNNDYQVRYINGNCWMVQNLRYVGDTGSTSSSMIMKADTSNISADQTITLYSLASSDSSYSGHCDSTNGYNYACTKDSGNTTNGVWYNYAVASAGYVTSNQNSAAESTESVCPKGWRLPTVSEMSGIASYQDAFFNGGSGVTGGFYDGGYVNYGGYGYWWSSTPYSSDSNFRWFLGYGGSLSTGSSGYRHRGIYVRCIRSTDMQDFSSTDAAAMSVGSTKTLTDTRDGQAYTVAKLADNKVWMLDNLRLSDSTIALTSDNSNVAYTSSNPWYLPTSISSGFNSFNTKMINTDYINTTTTSYGSGSGKIGVYYNYCAATAGTYCYASGSGTGNASYDICPKGWRMPTGGSSGEYQALYTAYSSNATNFRAALSTPIAGYFFNSSVINQGSYGGFWSSTRYDGDGDRMYSLGVYSSSVAPASHDGRNGGFSVRCILK